MSCLYIAEKPSLGRAIAAVLPRPHKNNTGYIEVGNGDIVTWCIGHLLEQVEPDAYDARYKKWHLEDLPIVPQQWQLIPRKAAKQQLAVIKKLAKTATSVVHAGDPDREGQLLVDEVIDYVKISKAKKESAQRLLISDLNPAAVKKALATMRSNRDFIPLSVSALARSRADWLYGMNMTRAYTLLGQKGGYRGVLSVGRVQTPILGLVVRRDDEIANFVAKPFYEVLALIAYGEQIIYAKWQPSKSCEPFQDPEGRVLHRKLCENVVERIKGQPAEVTESERKQTKQAPPLPYSLSALQIDAAKRFGMSAADVLSTCQSLYEKHKVITYPRSDSRHLPLDHFKQANDVCRSIAATDNQLATAVDNANTSLKSKAWNDKKVDAHHAIIPTPKSSSALTGYEAKIYQLIARQYLMQFYPAAEYADAKLVFTIANGLFIAKGRQLMSPGWRALLGRDDKKEDNDLADKVPPLDKGTVLVCRDGEIKDKMTEPPKAFTEATLLQAMTGIARFVSDASLKKILRDTDGLGTEATRAGILEMLFKRQLLQRQGKAIHASEAGKGLIYALPDTSTYPDMTAHWEHQLHDMAERKCAYQPFMAALEQQVTALMEQVKVSEVPPSLRSLTSPEFKPRAKKRSYAKKGTSAKTKSVPKSKS
ncbi:DNA topoisomerase III [Photobacterium kishitanii]|uniref:DNA topoisomerase III n=1 Tax=Photobacterium kishitanii TaxID=318456 RepID=UPI000D159967|nr:DNA topoisomerase III [Photobacterium kishitanii]PSU22856.1 DNA topoisomerase III [Photobacterium kishitanii]PSV16715.1 DNA topoisomerase III [Photobacterium kishitanii]